MSTEINFNKDVQQFLEKKRELQLALLNFLDNHQNQDKNFDILLQLFNTHKIRSIQPELYTFLCLISNISTNHHRGSNFFSKIEKILFSLEKEIKQSFSKSKIFSIFRENIEIVLFLIENKILTANQELANFYKEEKRQKKFFCHFFQPELQTFYDASLKQKINEDFQNLKIENFKEKRKIGENDKEICRLIRNDLVDDFISHVTSNRMNYSTTIDSSIFETNLFLIDKNPTILEYSAFFGSIKIFKYLLSTRARLTPSLWLYAIHGNNLEIIKLLNENRVQPKDRTFNECFIESIKCFNNEITNFIEKNLIQKRDEKILINCMKYYNYCYFPNKELLTKDASFYNLCKLNFAYLVELLVTNKNVNVNSVIESKSPLIIAAQKENIEIISYLLKHPNIDVNYQSII